MHRCLSECQLSESTAALCRFGLNEDCELAGKRSNLAKKDRLWAGSSVCTTSIVGTTINASKPCAQPANSTIKLLSLTRIQSQDAVNSQPQVPCVLGARHRVSLNAENQSTNRSASVSARNSFRKLFQSKAVRLHSLTEHKDSSGTHN